VSNNPPTARRTSAATAHADLVRVVMQQPPELTPYVGGCHVPSAGVERIPSVDPATEAVLWELPAGHADDVDAAVASALTTFATSPWAGDREFRVACLLRLASLIEANTERIAALDTLEIGIPIEITRADVDLAAAHIRDVVAMLADVEADVEAPARRVPRGAVAVIAPWNFPFYVALTKTVPTIAVGNTVVLKPSELASSSALLLAELATQAGMPAGVLNVVVGRGTIVGDALARHADIDQVNLTGSLATGRAVLAAAAAGGLAPVLTELGGKSAHVVGAHAPDLDVVADAIAANIFWCAGQVCTSGSRLIVHQRHHDALVERLVDRAAHWLPGDPATNGPQAGPLGSGAHLAGVVAIVDRAVVAGGHVVVGGTPGPRPGWYFPPTIVTEIGPHHELFEEEVFGPVLAVTRCASTAHGIELANTTSYGLTATGWSTDSADRDAD
jgi:acyl-CoA reductase-like NAD-dependent aldehyde dehydrogenase